MDRVDLFEIIEKLKKENSELKLKYNQTLLKIKSIEGQEAMDRVSTSLNEMVSSQAGLIQNDRRRNETGNSLTAFDNSVIIDPREVPKSYEVQSGDTLSKISEKFYGTANRWNDIYQANRDILSSARSLRAGQELLIP